MTENTSNDTPALLRPFIEIDIETLDIKQTAAIFQIGAVYVDPLNPNADRCLEILVAPDLTQRSMSTSTLKSHYSDADRHDLLQKAVLQGTPDLNAVARLAQFLTNKPFQYLYCRGQDFDFPILQHWAESLGYKKLFDQFWVRRDERTLIDAAALVKPDFQPARDTDKYPEHNALADARYQARVHVAAVEALCSAGEKNL
jgi:hypothetical protein